MSSTDRRRYEGVSLQFASPERVVSLAEARARVESILQTFEAPSLAEATSRAADLAQAFPDEAPPENFWHTASSRAFRDFFVWGHDHDFGHGVKRSGAMSTRHIEITSEGLSLGMIPADLAGKDVLDVGCWSGGDLLVLAGMGANVTAIEEHPIAARAARRLLDMLNVSAPIVEASVYQDRQEWAGKFDHIYCSGVIYHVTDPMLFLRILFAYLKPGGTVYLETKAIPGDGAESNCGYSGVLEKGWNWYAPNAAAFGRWLVDAGFDRDSVRVHRRENGRLLASATKLAAAALVETAGFSRPGSWLEGVV